jgi:hypothetical protein
VSQTIADQRQPPQNQKNPQHRTKFTDQNTGHKRTLDEAV